MSGGKEREKDVDDDGLERRLWRGRVSVDLLAS